MAVADGDPISKPVNLTSVYSVLHFKLKTDLKGDYYSKGFKINKIVMRTMGTDDEFKRKLIIDLPQSPLSRRAWQRRLSTSIFSKPTVPLMPCN
ncbi:hypothetical protein [Bacteroides rodentium]|uniref:hypothetical protein n=1 Tax=Bacteroides rodentium TaxID=691816 RepID=UPI0010084BAB|nr:hypothetical protein [Bacteroides rodentium]